MFDTELFNICDHKLMNQQLVVDGVSPSFTATLPFVGDKNRINTFIRGYEQEETYSGARISSIGITNYRYNDEGSEIEFGINPVEAGTIFIEGLTNYPPNFYMIDYTCAQVNCPKCLGTGIIHDIRYSPVGKYRTISGSEKLKQSFLKILLTEVGSNTYNLNYGSEIYALVGDTISEFTPMMIQKYIQDAFTKLQNIQTLLELTPEEVGVRISNMDISQDADDLSKLNISITITNAAYEEIPVILTLGTL